MSNEYKDWIADLEDAPVGSIDNNRWLCMEYPFLVPRNEKEEISENYDYSYTILDELPSGWRKLVLQMCEEIKEVLIEKYPDLLTKYYVVQAKEKYGTLRWYANIYVEELEEIATKYTVLSQYVCIRCGKATTIVSKDIKFLCSKCYERMNRIDKSGIL